MTIDEYHQISININTVSGVSTYLSGIQHTIHAQRLRPLKQNIDILKQVQ